jgi:hypothetical protein
MNTEGTGVCDATDIRIYECDGGAENAFIKDLPGMFQIHHSRQKCTVTQGDYF